MARAERGWRRLAPWAKAAAAVAILWLLFENARRADADALQSLLSQPKQWGLLAAALAAIVIAQPISYVRWWLIARAAELPLPLRQAMRLGALGYALNFVAPGSVGGDLLKAAVLASGHRGRRAAAVSTIAVDRILGLLGMLSVAAVAYAVASHAGLAMRPEVRLAGAGLVGLATVAALGVGLLLAPGPAWGRMRAFSGGLPWAGPTLAGLLDVWAAYRRNAGLLAGAGLLCLLVDFLLVAAFYAVAVGLPLEAPSLAAHLFIVPMALVASALPITLGGFGTREAVAELLYQGLGVGPGRGTLISLGFALTMLASGAIATAYYFGVRRSG